jgi:NAD(P)-dependent dehydrogenase (short-subunit alcohol dehydrogenase family)
MKIGDIRATTVAVPLEAPLRRANGCRWGRFGRMEELIGVAVLPACDGASLLAGQRIAVDGGYLASGVNS